MLQCPTAGDTNGCSCSAKGRHCRLSSEKQELKQRTNAFTCTVRYIGFGKHFLDYCDRKQQNAMLANKDTKIGPWADPVSALHSGSHSTD